MIVLFYELTPYILDVVAMAEVSNLGDFLDFLGDFLWQYFSNMDKNCRAKIGKV